VEFWRQQQGVLPAPSAGDRNLAAAITKKSLVAGRVAYYKAIRIGFAIWPAASGATGDRAGTSVKAWLPCLTARVLHRSYGSQFWLLWVHWHVNYLDASLFSQSSNSNSESIN